MSQRPSFPVRKKIRLPTYDYTSNGACFVAFCAHEKRCALGRVVGAAMSARPRYRARLFCGILLQDCPEKVMMRLKIVRTASAGTLESSDIYVEVAPGEGVCVKVDSVVKAQFGDAIEAAAREVCAELGVAGADLYVSDRGALDCTVRARVEAALRRAGEGAAE